MDASSLRCHKCGELKHFSLFTPDSRTKTGYKSWCRECVNRYASEKRKETSAQSLIDAAIALIHPDGLPDDFGQIEYVKIQQASGATLPEIRLQVMRTMQARSDAEIAAKSIEKDLGEERKP